MTGVPKLGKCANPECPTEFRRLGTGKIFTLRVNDPKAWGLPADVRQKVVWLCGKCSLTSEIAFDARQHQVRVVKKHALRQSA